jgi:hypothetical protein
VRLSAERLKTRSAHYLVYPPRSDTHAGFLAFRAWLRAQAGEHARHMEQAGLAKVSDTGGGRRRQG